MTDTSDTTFKRENVLRCMNSIMEQHQDIKIDPQPKEEQQTPHMTCLCAFAALYLAIQGYKGVVFSLSSISTFIDALYIGIIDGITQSNSDSKANKDEVFNKDEVGMLMSKVKQNSNHGVFNKVKEDLTNIYNARFEKLMQDDEALSKIGAVEKEIIKNKGAGIASAEDLLRAKLLEQGDVRAKKLLEYTNMADAFFTTGKVSIIRQAVCIGQTIGTFMQPILSSAIGMSKKEDVGYFVAAHAVAKQSFHYIIWATKQVIYAPYVCAKLFLSVAMTATIGFFDGISSSKDNVEQFEVEKTTNNIEIKCGENNKVALGFWNEITETYNTYKAAYSDMNKSLVEASGVSDLLRDKHDLIKSAGDMRFRRAILNAGFNRTVNVADKVFSAIESMYAVTVKNIYSASKQFGNAASEKFLKVAPEKQEPIGRKI